MSPESPANNVPLTFKELHIVTVRGRPWNVTRQCPLRKISRWDTPRPYANFTHQHSIGLVPHASPHSTDKQTSI